MIRLTILLATPLLLACLAAGCGDPAANGARSPAVVAQSRPAGEQALPQPVPPRSDPARPVSARPVPAWDATRCGDDEYRNARMERHPDLMNRTADDLLAAYGAPDDDNRFHAGEGVGTYSGGVASQLPGGAARNARTPVREIVWRRSGCDFIVRFVQATGGSGAWRVFDAFEASADADF